jgi:hypothetical protein
MRAHEAIESFLGMRMKNTIRFSCSEIEVVQSSGIVLLQKNDGIMDGVHDRGIKIHDPQGSGMTYIVCSRPLYVYES